MNIYRQIRQMSNRLLVSSEDVRELKIILCIIVGFLSHYVVFSQEYSYYGNYSAGFFRSFVYLILCSWVAQSAISLRMLGLCGLVTVSMLIDLAFVISPDWCEALSYIRYKAEINFKDLYTTYEATCILLSICYWIANYSSRRNDSDDDDPNNGSGNSDLD